MIDGDFQRMPRDIYAANLQHLAWSFHPETVAVSCGPAGMAIRQVFEAGRFRHAV